MQYFVRRAELVHEVGGQLIMLRSFLYDISESSKEIRIAAFPVRFYDEKLTFYEMRYRFALFCQQNQDETFENYDLLHLKLTLFAATECPHHFSYCTLFCAYCGEEFGCPNCHEKDHPFLFAGVKCLRCNTISRTLSYRCGHCGGVFGVYFCSLCCIFDMFDDQIKPAFHCNECGKCKIGIGLVHCSVCGTCRSKDHTCAPLEELKCPLCTETLAEGFMVTLKCGHLIHKICKDRMLQNNKFTCPQCRKLMLSHRQQILLNRRMCDLYQNEPISQRVLKRYYWFRCNECGGEFVEINHPIGARCPNHTCLSFNTSILQLCEPNENPGYIHQVQCQVLLEHGVYILYNHVNDIKYYQQLFPKLFRRFLSPVIEEDACSEDLTDGEVFQQILATFRIQGLDDDEIVDYLEIVELNYVHGMTLEGARKLLAAYLYETMRH